jgi:DNA recombination protein RmuC
MQELILGVAAAFVGILLGFWLRSASGKTEKVQREQRTQELAAELGSVRIELMKAQAESAARAGFESLAAERERTISQLGAERDGLRTEMQARNALESQSAARIKELETELRNERQNLAEKLALLETAKQALAHQFEALAGKILDEKSKTFSEDSQKEMGGLLTPLKTQIEEFRKKVEEAQKETLIGRTELASELKQLRDLNQNLSAEAHSLSTALRGSSKSQGDWGEFILRDLLEKAGLREGEQYSFQQRFIEVDDDGERKTSITDVVIKLPGGRHLIIDSKVSMDAYTDWVNSQDEGTREVAMLRHLSSIRSHINDLASKRYQELSSLETLDFVVMFVPIEPAFLAAIRAEETLWVDSYKQKVLLVSPTTLLFVIRIVHELWDQEVKARNYREVMDRGSKLYDKFVGFLKDIEGIGNGLANATDSFEAAKRKLTQSDSSLVRQVERLRALGVTPKVRKSKGKVTGLNVISEQWLDGSITSKGRLLIAASAESEDEDFPEQEGDSPATI